MRGAPHFSKVKRQVYSPTVLAGATAGDRLTGPLETGSLTGPLISTAKLAPSARSLPHRHHEPAVTTVIPHRRVQVTHSPLSGAQQ